MNAPIYKSVKGSIISLGAPSSGSIPVSNDNGKIDASWLLGFGQKRIELGSSVVTASNTKLATAKILFDQPYPTAPMVYVSLKTLYWNAKNSAGSIIVTPATDSFTVNFLVNTDSADVGWTITNPISFDWFSVGDFDPE